MNLLKYYTNGHEEWMKIEWDGIFYYMKTPEPAKIYTKTPHRNLLQELSDRHKKKILKAHLEANSDGLKLQKLFIEQDIQVAETYEHQETLSRAIEQLGQRMKEMFESLNPSDQMQQAIRPPKPTFPRIPSSNFSSQIKRQNNAFVNKALKRR